MKWLRSLIPRSRKSDRPSNAGEDHPQAEEIVHGPAGARATSVDFTATRADGTSHRLLLVDTLADGVTPTARERAAAVRIRAARPGDQLKLVAKRLV